MQIALFGGSFDPVHNGHIAVAREVLSLTQSVDEIWFVPDNVHHWSPIVASTQDRLHMLSLVVEKRMKVSDIAIRHGGKTYTIDIIRELQKQTKHTYIFICGSDLIRDFHKWKEYQELEKRLPFLVIPRVGYRTSDMPANCMLLSDKTYRPLDDSATVIREKIKKGESIHGLVPQSIESYIREKKLYEA